MAATHKGLLLKAYNSPIELTSLPTPKAQAGSVLVSVLATPVASNSTEVVENKTGFVLTLPMVPGNGFVGRVLEVGPDAVSLKPGQLVYVPTVLRARDDPSVEILFGLHSGYDEKAQKLMGDNWRNSSWQEKTLVPLESCLPLDEAVLCKKFGYTPVDLLKLFTLLVGFGGMVDIGLKAGETIIIAPATGQFSGSAVHMALSLGAAVIACGRKPASLESMKEFYATSPYASQFSTVVLTGDSAKDIAELKKATTGGEGAECYMDFSPPTVPEGKDHVQTCVMALKQGGRVSLMGFIGHSVALPYRMMVFKSIKVCGKYMYDTETVRQAIKMVEKGVLRLGSKGSGEEVTVFKGLDDWEEALKVSGEKQGWKERVVLTPVLE